MGQADMQLPDCWQEVAAALRVPGTLSTPALLSQHVSTAHLMLAGNLPPITGDSVDFSDLIEEEEAIPAAGSPIQVKEEPGIVPGVDLACGPDVHVKQEPDPLAVESSASPDLNENTSQAEESSQGVGLFCDWVM